MNPSGPPPSKRFRVVVDLAVSPGHSSCRLFDADRADVAPVNDFLDATAVRGLSPRTLRTYAYALGAAWHWLADRSLSADSLTEAHLGDFVRWLHENAVEGRAAPRSINLRLAVLRAFFRFHTGEELPRGRGAPQPAAALFRRVPCNDVGLPLRGYFKRPRFTSKVPRRLIEPLTREQVQRFFAGLRRWRDLSLTSLLLFCGLRSQEVLDLEIDDCSFELEQLRVRGKGSKDRMVPLARETDQALSAYLRLERPRACAHPKIFVVLKGPARGEPMTPSGLRSLFRYHRVLSGVPQAHPHRFRHTFASDMVRAGLPLPVLMRLMGHSQIEMTLRYVALSAEDIRAEFVKAIQRRQEDPS